MFIETLISPETRPSDVLSMKPVRTLSLTLVRASTHQGGISEGDDSPPSGQGGRGNAARP